MTIYKEVTVIILIWNYLWEQNLMWRFMLEMMRLPLFLANDIEFWYLVSFLQIWVGISSNRVLNTLRHITNINSIPDLSKYPVLHLFIHVYPNCGTKDMGMCFYLPHFRSRVCLHWFRYQRLGFESTLVVYITHSAGIGGRCDAYLPWTR